jgi:hypothetical protein
MKNDFSMSMSDVIDLIIPSDKDIIYKELFLSLIMKTFDHPVNNDYKKERIKLFKKKYPHIPSSKLNKLSDMQITFLETYLDTFFKYGDIKDFIYLMKTESIKDTKNRFKEFPSKSWSECMG